MKREPPRRGKAAEGASAGSGACRGYRAADVSTRASEGTRSSSRQEARAGNGKNLRYRTLVEGRGRC